MEITQTATADTTEWTGAVDGVEVAWFSVWTANGEISSVEVARAHQGEGLARALYTHADTTFPGGVFHTIPAHRSDDGDGFVKAIGGDVIDLDDAIVVEHCCCEHCDPITDEDEDEDY